MSGPSLCQRRTVLWIICCTFLLLVLKLPEIILMNYQPGLVPLPRPLISEYTEPPKRCHPKEHIVSIKTHKTAGSTLASIFQRYGMPRNFTFVAPMDSGMTGFGMIKRTKVYQYSKVIKHFGGFDMSVCHGRYNRTELDKLIPNATYVTAIRNPVTHFVSAFNYYKYYEQVHIPFNSKDILSKLFKVNDFWSKIIYGKHQATNGIAHDLNINITGNITEEIRRIDHDFDLIVVSEYFDESLILLKNLLCWEMDDLLYLSVRKHDQTYDYLYNVSDKVKSQILEINSIDAALYEHFNRTFWQKVEAYGPRFRVELAEFRRRLGMLQRECSASLRQHSHNKWGYNEYKILPNDTEHCKKFFIIDDVNTKTSRSDLERKLMLLEYEVTKNQRLEEKKTIKLNVINNATKRVKKKKTLKEKKTESLRPITNARKPVKKIKTLEEKTDNLRVITNATKHVTGNLRVNVNATKRVKTDNLRVITNAKKQVKTNNLRATTNATKQVKINNSRVLTNAAKHVKTGNLKVISTNATKQVKTNNLRVITNVTKHVKTGNLRVITNATKLV
ncbi:galactose-3-O-sulfotransferase 3-like [Amphiura filiformis]|uniref:galactose-3-O-sulfotransferase 3-like n=1 Tax=Amphiura filiformis TaxID=82378 RepID=UPI003B21E4F7